jgi:putative hemolysin
MWISYPNGLTKLNILDLPSPLSEQLYYSMFLLQGTTSTGYLYALAICLLVISGLISASEVAFFSLDSNDIRQLEEDKSGSSKRILQLKHKPRYLLATILIANNLVNIGVVLCADGILKNILGDQRLLEMGVWLSEFVFMNYLEPMVLGNAVNFLITVVGVTFILLLFGEATPKIYATYHKLTIAHIMAAPLTLLTYVFKPISTLLVKMSTGLEERLADTGNHHFTTKEDIDAAIELTVTDTENAEQEADILKGIVNFGDTSAKQIMHPRTDIVAVDVSASHKELMKLVRDSGYSRIPVYRDDFDIIEGILYVKDLLPYLDEQDDFKWQELIRKNVLFVPESKKIDELLREFQTKKLHMAVIVDEYGGTAGIATLEDIMEEVVGDIKDEFDEDDDIEFVKITDQHYIFEGKSLLKDVCRITGLPGSVFDEYRGDADSLAGLFLEVVGHIPRADQEIEIEQVTLKVVASNKKRIEKISLMVKAV